MALKVLYFAWVRERMGRSEETLEVPADVTTAGELISWLTRRDEMAAAAFARPETIRVAIDRRHVPHTAPLAGADEVAFFPPVTGG